MSFLQRRLPLIAAGLLWLLTAGLLWWVLRTVSAGQLLSTLSTLGPVQLGMLLLVNMLIAYSFGTRWWIILRAQGYSVPYPALASYRLVAFSISYFTPGPHFGGEPLQAFLVQHRHNVPDSAAVASVALDKLVEVLSNSGYLVVGIAITLQAQVIPGISPITVLGLGLILLSIPVMIIMMLARGFRPITWTLEKVLPSRRRLDSAIYKIVSASEEHAAILCRDRPWILLQALAISVAIWLALLGEFWLAVHFVGVDLSPTQLLVAITAARIAILLPLPGGLGSLEASQVFVMGMLGFNPAVGLSASLLTRARDILFGLLGLWWGSMAVGGWHTLWSKQGNHDST